jgi:oligopeptide/dipeptide ABC transporter ATP-binding protein
MISPRIILSAATSIRAASVVGQELGRGVSALDESREDCLAIRDLTVTYYPESGIPIRALDGVSIDIRPNEVLGILGESGCGKSTIANALLRSLPPHARCEGGAILVRGRNLLYLSERDLRAIRGRTVSLIPQDPAQSLNPVMTSGSQIGEVLRAHLPLDARQRRERVLELLGEVGFADPEEIYSAYPHQLSGGQRQRITIAQAVACRPAFLIADEPTSKLDAALQAEILVLLAQVRRIHGTAVLVISHDPTVFAGFADRIAVMYAGRIVEIGSGAQIFARPLHPYTQALVGIATHLVFTGSRVRTRIPTIEGQSSDPTCTPVGCRFEPRCSARMGICAQRYPHEVLTEPSHYVNCFKHGE